MKTTIDVPDELYRKVKAKSAIQGRRVRDVTVELFQRWIGERPAGKEPPGSAAAWLEDWLRLGDEQSKKAPGGPSAREILEQDRGRLDRR